MKPEEWIGEFAAAIELDAPDATTVEELLDLAAVAAHASARTAAPVACYLAGLSGRPVAELKGAADGIGAVD